MNDDYDPRRARGKRPLPLWVDAFTRDTQDLGPDEIGVYFLILMAMWTRPSCDFANDEKRLARIARVTPRLWRSRLGPAVMPFFAVEGDVIVSHRLQQEAKFVERALSAQSQRKKGDEKSAEKGDAKSAKNDVELHEILGTENRAENAEILERKYLKNNKQTASADITAEPSAGLSAEVSPEQPTQLPNYPTYDDDDDGRARGAGPSIYDRIRQAAGVASCQDPSEARRLGMKFADVNLSSTLAAWRGLGFDDETIVASISAMTDSRRGAPPSTPGYFTPGLRKLAGERSAAPLTPIPPINGDPDHGSASPRPRYPSRAERDAAEARQGAARRFAAAAALPDESQ